MLDERNGNREREEERSPRSAEDALVLGAEVLAGLGKYSEARVQLDAALQANPENTQAKALLETLNEAQIAPLLGDAAGHFLSDRLEEAEAIVDQALAIVPDHEHAIKMRASIRERRGSASMAEKSETPAVASSVPRPVAPPIEFVQDGDLETVGTEKPGFEDAAQPADAPPDEPGGLETIGAAGRRSMPAVASEAPQESADEGRTDGESVETGPILVRQSRWVREWPMVAGVLALALALGLILWLRAPGDEVVAAEDANVEATPRARTPDRAADRSIEGVREPDVRGVVGSSVPPEGSPESSLREGEGAEPSETGAPDRPQSAPQDSGPSDDRSEAAPDAGVAAAAAPAPSSTEASKPPPTETPTPEPPERESVADAAMAVRATAGTREATENYFERVSSLVAEGRTRLEAGDWEGAVESAWSAMDLAPRSSAVLALTRDLVAGARDAALRAQVDAQAVGAAADGTPLYRDALRLVEEGAGATETSPLAVARKYYVAAGLFERATEQAQLRSVGRAIDRFAAAHREVDFDALTSIWPTLSGERYDAVADSFAQAKQVDMTISGCATSLVLGGARSTCDVTQAYVPRRGLRQSTVTRMRFELRREGREWRITSVQATAP